MDGKTDKKKRVISVGLVKPSDLEGDVIYVSFNPDRRLGGIKATAVSNEDFRYHCYALNGTLLFRFGKETANVDGDGTGSFLRPRYRGFLDDLVESNEGVLDYDRLVIESVKTHSRLGEIKDLMSLKFISLDRIQASSSPDC